MASAILIGCDINKRRDCVTKGIEMDLKGLDYELKKTVKNVPSAFVPGYRGREIVQKLRTNYEEIVGMEEFVEWVKRQVVDRRTKEDKEELAKAVKSLYEVFHRAKEKWSSEWTTNTPATLAALPRHAELVADEKNRYLLGRFYQSVNKLSACRSRIFDYVLICTPYSLSLISEQILRANRGMGKEVKDAIANGSEYDRIKKNCISELDNFQTE